MDKERATGVSATTHMNVDGDATWHAHLISVAALLKTSKGRLARKAIDVGLPVLVKQMCSEELLPFVKQHLEAMGIRVKGQE